MQRQYANIQKPESSFWSVNAFKDNLEWTSYFVKLQVLILQNQLTSFYIRLGLTELKYLLSWFVLLIYLTFCKWNVTAVLRGKIVSYNPYGVRWNNFSDFSKQKAMNPKKKNSLYATNLEVLQINKNDILVYYSVHCRC